jgi:cbb3-type cytochrome oxidase cytochrome c subunit
MAVTLQAPLGRLADPTDTSYIPRPEWYFLFLFQTLKFFEGPLEVVGAHILPGLAVVALILAPFIDRGQLRKITKRTTALTILLVAGGIWTALTVAAIRSTPPEAAEHEFEAEVQQWQMLTAEELSGLGYFRKENCYGCHVLGTKGKAVGPDLTKLSGKRDVAWLIAHFKQPAEKVPGSSMPPVQLPDSQLNSLAAFILKLKPTNAEGLDTAPEPAVNGAMLYQKTQCGICHQINNLGMKLGPPLNGLAQRRKREWVVEHFAEPKKLVPGSTMPPYRFKPEDLENITSYMMALPAKPPTEE